MIHNQSVSTFSLQSFVYRAKQVGKNMTAEKRQDGNIKIQGVAAKIYYEFIIKWIWLFSAIKSFFFQAAWNSSSTMNMYDIHEYVWYSWICMILMNMYIHEYVYHENVRYSRIFKLSKGFVITLTLIATEKDMISNQMKEH